MRIIATRHDVSPFKLFYLPATQSRLKGELIGDATLRRPDRKQLFALRDSEGATMKGLAPFDANPGDHFKGIALHEPMQAKPAQKR